MRKLFNTGSSVVIEEFSTMQINGPYALLKLGPDFAIVQCGDYMIEVSGEDLTVDVLQEEVAIFIFTTITAMNVSNKKDREAVYGS